MTIGNTAKTILAAVHQIGRGGGNGCSVLDVVYARYPQTQQPLKKCKTFGGHMRRLVRAGHLREVGGRYFITPTSRQAFNAKLGTPMQEIDWPFMRLVQ